MNFGYALGKGLEAGANAGAQVMDNTMREQAEMRAADRRLADQERLMAAQEMMLIRAGARAQAFKVDDETRADARLTDADRAKKIAMAGEAAAGVKAKGEIDRTIDLAGNQSYLNAARKLKQNEQITSPAQALALEAAQIDLNQRKALIATQDALRHAMKAGDAKETERLVREIAVLGGKGDPINRDFTEREKARAATLMATLKDIDATPEEKKAARAELYRLTSGGGQGSPQASLDQPLGLQIAQTASGKAQKPGSVEKGKPLMEQAKSAQGVQMGNGGDKVLASIESDAVAALTPLARKYQTAQAQYVATARSGDQASLARYMQAMEAARQKLESEAQSRFGNAAQRVLDNLLAQK